MAMPVLFGPIHANSFQALELLRHNAAVLVTNENDMAMALEKLITDVPERQAMAERARAYVESQLGATERCMETIVPYL